MELMEKQNPCQKGYRCLSSDISELCKTAQVVSGWLDCLAEEPADCNFSRLSGIRHHCECPMRKYIANEYEC